MNFICGKFQLDLSTPKVMGIVNVTPDSFSDGGRFSSTDKAIAHANDLVAQGADILDIGGESTRPGATPVPLDEELNRVIPVIEGLAGIGIPLSIDTYKSETMRQALLAGVECINDIWALRKDGAISVIAENNDCGIVLMHMQRDPLTMQFNPDYQDVIAEVKQFLGQHAQLLINNGVNQSRIVIDPGFGFGKSLEHNLEMLANFNQFTELSFPVLAGMSRKSMIGKITGKEADDRMAPSVASAIMAADRGAKIVRVHDVAQTVDAMKLWEAVQR